MRRPTAVLRIAALATSAGLVLLSAAPGTAAQPLAQGSATGLSLTVGGTPTDSGSYEVSNDGSGETRTGSRNPQIRVLGGQDFVSAGTLAQNAATRVRGGDGRVVACAGLAGDGATVAEVGEGDCLSPGRELELEAGTLELRDIEPITGENIPDELQLPPEVRDQVLGALSDALQDAVTQLGDPGVFMNVGAIQSTCEANSSRAIGDATLADVSLSLRLPGGQELGVLSLPVNPPPNTKLPTGLPTVVESFRTALQSQFEKGLGDGQLAPLGNAVDQVLEAVNTNVITPFAAQLGPVQDNLLDGTLNKQVKQGRRSIEVTALEARVLPVAAEQAGGDVLTLDVGRTACATADAVAPAAPPANPRPPATVPTSVPSGLADAPADDSGVPAGVALAGIGLVAVTIGVGTYRRRTTD